MNGFRIAADPNTIVELSKVCPQCEGEGRRVWLEYNKSEKKEVRNQTKCPRCHRGHIMTPNGRALLDFIETFKGQ